jgi:hypothetical protein
MMTEALELEDDKLNLSIADAREHVHKDAPAMRQTNCDELETMPLASVLYQLLVHRRDVWNGAAWAAALGAENR